MAPALGDGVAMLKLWLLLVVVSRAAGVRVPAPPTTAELLLAACKVTRLPEAQRLPAALRLTSTTSVVAAAFEQLPALGCEVGKGATNLSCTDQCDLGSGHGICLRSVEISRSGLASILARCKGAALRHCRNHT